MSKETNPFYHYEHILAIYQPDSVVSELTEQLSHVIKFFIDGDRWHRRHANTLSKEEAQEYMQFLKDLRELAENMSVEEERSLIIQDETLRVNLNPWIAFMEKNPIHEVLYILRGIKVNMLAYLHEDNIMEFRDSIATLDRFEYAITGFLFRDIFD